MNTSFDMPLNRLAMLNVKQKWHISTTVRSLNYSLVILLKPYQMIVRGEVHCPCTSTLAHVTSNSFRNFIPEAYILKLIFNIHIS